MMRALFVWVASCLLAVSDSNIINRCTLAKILYKEDLDGFEGYSLPDCECLLLSSFLPTPALDLLPAFLPLPFVFPSGVQRTISLQQGAFPNTSHVSY